MYTKVIDAKIEAETEAQQKLARIYDEVHKRFDRARVYSTTHQREGVRYEFQTTSKDVHLGLGLMHYTGRAALVEVLEEEFEIAGPVTFVLILIASSETDHRGGLMVSRTQDADQVIYHLSSTNTK